MGKGNGRRITGLHGLSRRKARGSCGRRRRESPAVGGGRSFPTAGSGRGAGGRRRSSSPAGRKGRKLCLATVSPAGPMAGLCGAADRACEEAPRLGKGRGNSRGGETCGGPRKGVDGGRRFRLRVTPA